MKKKIIVLLIIFIFFSALINLIGPYDYYCYRCGAYRYGVIFYTIMDTNGNFHKWIQDQGIAACQYHEWELHSATLGLGDCFVLKKIPIYHLYMYERVFLSQISLKEDRISLIIAASDRKNKLRWLLVGICTLALKNTLTIETWKQWKNNFADLLFSERDLETARLKAHRIIEKIKDYYDIDIKDGYQRAIDGYKMKINQDLKIEIFPKE